MTLSALIFDVDGTLADTEEVHRLAFNAAFAEAGYGWNWDRRLYTRLLAVTGGRARIRFYLRDRHPELLAGDGDEAMIAALHKCKTEHYVAAIEERKVPLRPGVEKLLVEARDQGLTLAIATTTTPANVRALIESTIGPAALDWFKVIGAGDCVENLKPAPDVYLWVLHRLALEPARCLAVEDSANGLKASLAADVPTLVTSCPYTRDHDFTGALRVLDGLDEVGLDMIRRWHGLQFDRPN